MPSFDLLTIKPIEALSEAKPREVLNQTLARLQSSSEWVDEGAPRAAILRVIDPDFINHAEHYDKLIKGGVRTDGTKFKGGGGIDEMVMDVGDATAGVTVKGSYEWDARPHTYTARVQFQNFKTISTLKEHTWTEKARLLLSDNIRIDCDCNAFRYFHRRAATTKGFALVAETRPSRVRNPLGKSGVCKHLEHVLRYVGGSYGRMASAMKKSAQSGGVNEAYGVEASASGFSPEESGAVSASDRAKVDAVVNDPQYPATAEDGKAYVVHWAGGRGIFALKKKADLVPWLNKAGEWAEILSIKHKEPVHGGKTLRVR